MKNSQFRMLCGLLSFIIANQLDGFLSVVWMASGILWMLGSLAYEIT